MSRDDAYIPLVLVKFFDEPQTGAKRGKLMVACEHFFVWRDEECLGFCDRYINYGDVF